MIMRMAGLSRLEAGSNRRLSDGWRGLRRGARVRAGGPSARAQQHVRPHERVAAAPATLAPASLPLDMLSLPS
jgi:hypothetical protein